MRVRSGKREEMRSFVLGVLVAVVLLLGLAAGTEQWSGRYQIVMRDEVRADTYLLDSKHGRVWQLTKLTEEPTEPIVWLYMTRLDDDVEALEFSTDLKKAAVMLHRLEQRGKEK